MIHIDGPHADGPQRHVAVSWTAECLIGHEAVGPAKLAEWVQAPGVRRHGCSGLEARERAVDMAVLARSSTSWSRNSTK